jgi:hypothetical protein
MSENQNEGSAGWLIVAGLGLAGYGVHKGYAGGVGQLMADFTEAWQRAQESPQSIAPATRAETWSHPTTETGKLPICSKCGEAYLLRCFKCHGALPARPQTLLQSNPATRRRPKRLRVGGRFNMRSLLLVEAPKQIAVPIDAPPIKSKRGGRLKDSRNTRTNKRLRIYDGFRRDGMADEMARLKTVAALHPASSGVKRERRALDAAIKSYRNADQGLDGSAAQI